MSDMAVPSRMQLAPCGKSKRLLKFGGLSREYAVYVPKSLCRDAKAAATDPDVVPLVVAIHCFGCTASNILWISEAAAEEFGFVLAAPEGHGRSFNAGVCCGRALEEDLDDVGFCGAVVRRLLDSGLVAHGVSLSPKAVYAMGFSNGGYMASLLAVRSPAIRGFAALAGHTYELPRNLTPRAMSLHMMKADSFVRYGGCCASERCCCGIGERWSGPCVSAEAIFDSWLRINRCDGSTHDPSASSVLPARVDCRVGTRCLRPTRLCSYLSEALQHQMWSGSFPDQRAVGAFFARDACSIGGAWEMDHCRCSAGSRGRHCLSAVTPTGERTSTTASPESITKSSATASATAGGLSRSAWQPMMAALLLLVLPIVVCLVVRRRGSSLEAAAKPRKPGDAKPPTRVGAAVE